MCIIFIFVINNLQNDTLDIKKGIYEIIQNKTNMQMLNRTLLLMNHVSTIEPEKKNSLKRKCISYEYRITIYSHDIFSCFD